MLVKARLQKCLVDKIPQTIRPNSLEEAYAVQQRLVEILDWDIGGWFCGCANKSTQSMLNLNEPYYGRLLAPYIFESGRILNVTEFPPMLLECEFGFRLGYDLPPKKTSYSRVEVVSAVATLHPTIEVVFSYFQHWPKLIASHLEHWSDKDVFSVIADNGTGGALIYGTGIEDWQYIDFSQIDVNLAINGKFVRARNEEKLLGDPIDALVWLANAQAQNGEGLKKGHIHNTGTVTDILWVNPGDEAIATFSEIGSVTLSVK